MDVAKTLTYSGVFRSRDSSAIMSSGSSIGNYCGVDELTCEVIESLYASRNPKHRKQTPSMASSDGLVEMKPCGQLRWGYTMSAIGACLSVSKLYLGDRLGDLHAAV